MSSLSSLHIEGRYHTSLSGSVDFQPAAGKIWFIRELVIIATATNALQIRHSSQDGAEDGTYVLLQTFSPNMADTFEDKGSLALGDEGRLTLLDTNQTGFAHFLGKGVVLDDTETTPKVIKTRLVGGSGNQDATETPATGKGWILHDAWYWWHVDGTGGSSSFQVTVRDEASGTTLKANTAATENTFTDFRPTFITDQMDLYASINGGAGQFDSSRDVLELLALAEEVDLDS